MYPGNQQHIVAKDSEKAVMAPTYPPESIPHCISSAGNFPKKSVISRDAQVASSTPHYPNKVVATEDSTVWGAQRAASVTYSGQEPPTSYQVKEQPGNAA